MNLVFDSFIDEVEQAMQATQDEAMLLERLQASMAKLVAQDNWLPEAYAQPHPQFYQQYLLHRDTDARFSVVSFVWGPGQRTPIHDHMVWGVIGMLRGSEYSQPYTWSANGLRLDGACEQLHPGDVAAVSPSIGDIHQVSNVYPDQVSISIHIYGTDIGQQPRHVFDPMTGESKAFVSGYANASGGC